MRIMLLNHRSRQASNPENESRLAAVLASYTSPGTTIETHYPQEVSSKELQSKLRQHKNLAGLHHILETPALIKKAMEAERAGYDAVVQTNTFDAGVEAARLAVRIPVVGLLRSACHFAACLCERFGVIVPLDSHVNYVWRILETYRMAPFVTAIRAINMYDDINRQHDLIVERTVDLGRSLVADGAQAIIPLGAIIFPYEVAPEELEPAIGVPVINTTAVGLRFAELMVLSKTTHSSKAYPWAPGITPEDLGLS